MKTLIMEYIGKDDFSNPMYKDQNGRLWKDLNMGRRKPDLYSVTGNDPDGEPLYPINAEYIFDPAPYQENPYEFEYMLLDRMRMDCDYYLGYGRRAVSILGGDPQKHINEMKELWKGFPEDGKPQWLTWKEILKYEDQIKISFYAAECSEFHNAGEFWDKLTLKEAYERYKQIPSERMNAIKCIGFTLHDGSDYDGLGCDILCDGVITGDMIETVPYFNQHSLVQQAIKDIEEIIKKNNK